MAKLLDYAAMCSGAYKAPDSPDVPGFQSPMSVAGDAGFKGAIYHSSNEVVVAFAGTELDQGAGAAIQDITADLRLMTDMPRQMNDARVLFEYGQKYQAALNLPHITVCGHSLGGGLTQFMAYWSKENFVTFNAPGVYTAIQGVKFCFLHSPQKALRTWKATFAGHADGYNYRMPDDAVSRLGIHYGPLITIQGGEMDGGVGRVLAAHMLGAISRCLQLTPWGSRRPFGY